MFTSLIINVQQYKLSYSFTTLNSLQTFINRICLNHGSNVAVRTFGRTQVLKAATSFFTTHTIKR